MRLPLLVSFATLLLGTGAGYAVGRIESHGAVQRLAEQSKQLRRLADDVSEISATCRRVRVVSVRTSAPGEVANAEEAKVPVAAGVDAEPSPDQSSDEQSSDEQGSDDQAMDLERGEQRRKSRDIIDHALRVGYWSEQDASSFQSLVHELDAEERGSLMQELAVLFNEGRLRYDGAGPAF